MRQECGEGKRAVRQAEETGDRVIAVRKRE